jgi:excisionase family DNA binding protein
MSERQVWRWIDSTDLQVHRFGRAVRIKWSDFEAFAAQCRKKN